MKRLLLAAQFLVPAAAVSAADYVPPRGSGGTRHVVSADWIRAMTTPSKPRPDYGLLWWLNTDRKALPAAPATVFWAAGFGGSLVYVNRGHDLVIVLRWVPEGGKVVAAILEALRS